MKLDKDRLEYANKCLRYHETSITERKMEFVDDECIGAGGKKPDKGSCYPNNGFILGDVTAIMDRRDGTIKDACAGNATVGTADDIPSYLDAISPRFTIPKKFK